MFSTHGYPIFSAVAVAQTAHTTCYAIFCVNQRFAFCHLYRVGQFRYHAICNCCISNMIGICTDFLRCIFDVRDYTAVWIINPGCIFTFFIRKRMKIVRTTLWFNPTDLAARIVIPGKRKIRTRFWWCNISIVCAWFHGIKGFCRCDQIYFWFFFNFFFVFFFVWFGFSNFFNRLFNYFFNNLFHDDGLWCFNLGANCANDHGVFIFIFHFIWNIYAPPFNKQWHPTRSHRRRRCVINRDCACEACVNFTGIHASCINV